MLLPLFPSLAKHYLANDGDNFFLQAIFKSISYLVSTIPANGTSIDSKTVLFGGALGALYSILQFIFAPIWGSLSDKFGRRPILIICVLGLFVSYIIWGFAGSFTLLILGRLLGGIMSGNISTATAVVADITDSQNRSKGMAVIGIAFALGFIVGPAVGGMLSLIDLSKRYPDLVNYGVNPFSMPAFFSALLAGVNLLFLITKFKETLPVELQGKVQSSERTLNIFKMFKPLPYPAINLTNFANFIYILSFAGMEFTLTFLVVERLGYTSMQNAYMFIFMGFTLVMVQGGFVRRRAHKIGEKRMVLMGLILLFPGLTIISQAHSTFMIYLGIFFISVGSAMITTCLTALNSLFTPPEVQGKSLGIFRSLGALGRAIGPIYASLVYWYFGSAYPYVVGMILLLIPIILIAKVPKVAAAV